MSNRDAVQPPSRLAANRLGGRRTPAGLQAVHETGTHAGRFKVAGARALLVDAILHELEDVLHDDRLLLHVQHFGDVGDLSRPALQPVGLNDQVDRRRKLLANRLERQFDPAHRDHRFDTGNGVARVVGVDRRHRAFVAGVHRLQHVERFTVRDIRR